MLRLRPRRPDGLPELCQPTITVKPPAGPGWLHELKYDGFRLLARRDGAGTRLFTRRGNDWTERYPLVASAIGVLKARSCAIDGEIAICDSDGLPVFDLLRHGPRVKREAVLFAFDLLELDGRNLTREPIEARKAALAKLLHQALPSLQLIEHLEADGGRDCQNPPMNTSEMTSRTKTRLIRFTHLSMSMSIPLCVRDGRSYFSVAAAASDFAKEARQ